MTLLKLYFLSISKVFDEFAKRSTIIEFSSLKQYLDDTGDLTGFGQ